jgi:hypothetical protein
MSIDTVIYQNASQATIKLSGYVNRPVEVSITLKAKILNSFEDLTSNTLIVGTDFTPEIKSAVNIFTTQNTIHLECSKPELLGEKVEIFNLSGQLIKTAKTERLHSNSISINLLPGIYFCRYVFDKKKQTQRITFVH